MNETNVWFSHLSFGKTDVPMTPILTTIGAKGATPGAKGAPDRGKGATLRMLAAPFRAIGATCGTKGATFRVILVRIGADQMNQGVMARKNLFVPESAEASMMVMGAV